jgi:hypothetical protein
MPRIDQRRLPLLVVLVAMLGVLGVVVADGWPTRVAPMSGGVEAVASSAGTTDADGAAADAAVDTRAVVGTRATVDMAGGVAPGFGRASHLADQAGFVQVAADHVRPLTQTAPALLVLAAVFLFLAGARSVVPTFATAVARPLPLAHVRRRGPPALVVV